MLTRVVTTHSAISIVIAAFLALGILYGVTTPLFEAPDEQWHFAFVQYVAQKHALPEQKLDRTDHLARQEASQPPLYYLLAAAATFWIDTSDFPAIIWENPHYGFLVPGIVNDNKNLFIHTAQESFPYRGVSLAIHVARLVSVLIGALAVMFTYLLALEIFRERVIASEAKQSPTHKEETPALLQETSGLACGASVASSRKTLLAMTIAAASASFVAFVPQFIFVSSAVSNDSAIVAASALSIWPMIRLLRVEPRARDVVVLGAATGLAALVKVSGLGLVFLAALVLLIVQRKNLRAQVLHLSLLAFGFTLVAGWWYLRNLVLYGELTGTETMLRVFGERGAFLTLAQLFAHLSEVWETFWIGFGWGNVRANPITYLMIGVLMAASGVGLLRFAIADLRLPIYENQKSKIENQKYKILVLAFWILLSFTALLRWIEITQAPHGRLFFPALPALAPLVILGLYQWKSMAALTAPVALFALSVYAVFAILAPAYAYPATLTTSELQNIPQRVDINYDDKLKLLGYNISPRRVSPDGAIEVTLYWQSLATMDEDYSIGIALLDANQRVLSTRTSYPGHGMLPTNLWRKGLAIRDSYWVPIPANAPAPSIAQIQVSLFKREDKSTLATFDPSGHSITPIVGRFKIGLAQSLQSQPVNSTAYLFGEQIVLIDSNIRYFPPSSGTSPGFVLTLYWKRLAPIGADYTVFVHVLNANDEIVAQRDQEPASGTSPTSFWDDGEIVVDHYPFDLSGAPNSYRVRVGLYRAETGERLEVRDSAGKTIGDAVIFEIGKTNR